MKKVINWGIHNIILWYLLGIGLTFVLMFLYYSYFPLNHWLVFHYIKPTQDAIVIGDDLYIETKGQTKKHIEIEWGNGLYCDLGDSLYTRFSFSETHRIKKPSELAISRRRYEGRLPKQEAKCYITSEGKLLFPLGVRRSIKRVSGPFYFIK